MKKNKNLHRGTAKRIFEWCVKNYGRSKYNGTYPNLKYVDTNKLEGFTGDGFYEDLENTIYVNSKSPNIKNLEDLARTIIHEYSHYKFHNMNKYYDLAEKFTHDNHPYEIEANQIEDRDYTKCLLHMRQIFKIK
jgi:hypothetical protein